MKDRERSQESKHWKEEFLDEVAEQLRYPSVRPSICRELAEHIDDRMEAYEQEGCTAEEAERRAVLDMGDAVSIGAELNEVHQLQKNPALAGISLLLLTIGFVFAWQVRWTPEQLSNGCYYYLFGAVVLVLTGWKGYPIFLRHWRKLMVGIIGVYAVQIGMFLARRYGAFLAGTAGFAYWATVLMALVLTTYAYVCRKEPKRTAALLMGTGAVWLFLMAGSTLYIHTTATLIFLLSLGTTLWFMGKRGMFSVKHWKRYGGILTGILAVCFLVGHSFFADSLWRKVQVFAQPESVVTGMWDDAYNGILMKKLLSQTPLTHGLELTPEELMDYGSGAWYFASRDPRRIGVVMEGLSETEREAAIKRSQKLWDEGIYVPYLHYNQDTVTLWDILPQHYHNNYVIAVVILLFGWLPGLLLVGLLALFYVLLFCCIHRIRGNLAYSVSVCCGQCLLWQGVLYLLGNFGFQFATFPNLPLLSEGRFSILCNMLLLGMIFSAYRYDRVADEKEEPVLIGVCAGR